MNRADPISKRFSLNLPCNQQEIYDTPRGIYGFKAIKTSAASQEKFETDHLPREQGESCLGRVTGTIQAGSTAPSSLRRVPETAPRTRGTSGQSVHPANRGGMAPPPAWVQLAGQPAVMSSP